VKYGAASYRWNSPVSSIINKLFKKYQKEGMAIMPYTIEDYQREVKEEVLKSLTKEDMDHLLKELPPEDLLRVLKPEDLLRVLKPEDLLRVLKPEEIEEYLRKIKR